MINKKYLLGFASILCVVSFSGCNDTKNSDINMKKEMKHYHGKQLLKQKCSQCHNIDFPPKDFKDEIAPAMMTISFHFNDWFKGAGEAEKLQKQQDFVADYVINPSLEKSYCDKTMLKKFGLMPSQKGNVTKDEVRAIAKYVFTNYTPQKLSKKQKALDKLHSLPLGEQLTIKYKCSSCHTKTKKIVGPSFKAIGTKYKQDIEHISNSIKNGSKGIWKASHGATMPQFHSIPKNDRETIAQWMINL